MKTVVITGGIGAGKSVVSKMLNVMGWQVYDCDANAKALLHNDAQVRHEIISLLGSKAYDEHGQYDRRWVSEAVFGNPELLQRLDDIVHPAVLRDIERWKNTIPDNIAFIETALLRQSGLYYKTDVVWRVTAPDDLRVSRVQQRSQLTRQQVEQRIVAQRAKEAPYELDVTLVNDGVKPLLPQVTQALAQIMNKKSIEA